MHRKGYRGRTALAAATGGLLLLFAHAPQVFAQGTVALTTSIFTQGSRSSTAGDSSYGLDLGSATSLGASYLTGPHRLTTGYTARVDQPVVEYRDAELFWEGSTGYRLVPRHGRFDLNLGHSIRAVAEEENFLLDVTSYSTRNTLSAGGGVNANPAGRTQLRLATQGTRAFSDGWDLEGSALTTSATASRRLTVSQTLSLSLSRSLQWGDSDDYLNTVDSAEVGYSRALPNGRFSAGIGVSEFSSDTATQEAVTGNVSRSWVNEVREFSLQYSRSFSNTLRELELELGAADDAEDPDNGEVEPETLVIELQTAVLRDAVSASYSTGRLCAQCQWGNSAELSTQEDVFTGDRSSVYAVGTRLDFQHSDLLSSGVGYDWRSTGDGYGTDLDSQQHRLSADLRRQLSERATTNASIEHSWRQGADAYRTLIRVGLDYGLFSREF